MSTKARSGKSDGQRPVAQRAAFWMIVGACGYAGMIGVVKQLSSRMDINIAFYRYFLALLAMLPRLIPSGSATLKTQRLGLHN
ncbi:MAG: hypothetical protein QGG19_03730 [Alphaproteobacteria bacterium]|jgi:drug/metabolite transporter (DMT)-like permease|nr:hypothetical protein [Alphaproteobacteria bacterium]MDP6254094.1 hypothetical protein [Alphaproteobacteria bacterium]MDP7052767.1 hypothetical protein [Alphaproteobacteria bacterium]MDP7229885.1 hypothetical protein [Alphaproteobacteria bacterium]MDP7460929.1 hypothetical protein [Alphaproteobacteria bacterium]|tara:strand:+ start:6578 stop:6826 length:249 start_codon:yes stop_codon:yes gene_type:complete